MRIAIVGAGRWGAIHCQKVKMHANAELVGVVDCQARKATELARAFGTLSYRSITECTDADGLIIATPIQGLVGLAGEALSLGMPFLVEKPLSTQTQTLRALMTRWEAHLQGGCVGYQLRYHPLLDGLKQQGTYRFVRHESHFTTVEALLEDCGVHELDLARYLLGPELEIEVVRRTRSQLVAVARAPHGASMELSWQIDGSSVRMLTSPKGNIDYARHDHDLLSLQLSEFVSRTPTRTRTGATIADAYVVAEMFESVLGQASRV